MQESLGARFVTVVVAATHGAINAYRIADMIGIEAVGYGIGGGSGRRHSALFLRSVREAERLLRIQQPHAAMLLAGIVLDEAIRSRTTSAVADGEDDELRIWLEMRNRAAHTADAGMPPEQVRAMVRGVREMVERGGARLQGEPRSSSADGSLDRIRGKYAFVNTSVDEFLRRKHEESELEDPTSR